MTTGEGKSGWSTLAKGAAGTVLVAVAGFFGTAAMTVLSAPKDSVAYDLIQSVTGMLKSREAPAPAPAERPAPVERQAVAPQPQQSAPPAPAPVLSAGPPEPAFAPASKAYGASPPDAPADPSAGDSAPAPESMADRARQTAELARKVAASTAMLNRSRVLSLNDRARTPICGATYRIEVTSVAAGRGEIALHEADREAAPIRLVVGQPRDVGTGCRVELIGAMDDISNRRAQLRETLAR